MNAHFHDREGRDNPHSRDASRAALGLFRSNFSNGGETISFHRAEEDDTPLMRPESVPVVEALVGFVCFIFMAGLAFWAVAQVAR